MLKTNIPITLNGTTNNKLTYKFRYRSEFGFDWGYVLIKDGAAASRWDTLASYSGDFGTACNSPTIDIPNSWTTAPQPTSAVLKGPGIVMRVPLRQSPGGTRAFPLSGADG